MTHYNFITRPQAVYLCFRRCLLPCLLLGLQACSSALQISRVEPSIGNAYYYVDHFETVIDKPVQVVWPHVIAMGQWMPWMADPHSESDSLSEGQRIHLYGDSYVEVAKIIPSKMILLANMPNREQGEMSQGIAMITVAEVNGQTLVSLFMSRFYLELNPQGARQQATRESADFASQRRDKFEHEFLARLKSLVEFPH